MSKILILTTKFINILSPTGICTKNLICELEALGNEIFVACYADSDVPVMEDGMKIYPVHNVKRNLSQGKPKIHKVATAMLRFAIGIFTPVFDKKLVDSYCIAIKTAYVEDKIDAVIGMFFPLEALEAVSISKYKFPSLKTITFEVDSIQDGIHNHGINKLHKNAYIRWIKKCYSEIDHIFILRSHKRNWERNFAKKFGNKEKITDVPVLLSRETMIYREQNERISFIYCGHLDRKYRSPNILLETLKILDKTMNFQFDFFTKGDCEEEVKTTGKLVSGIVQRGYVAREVLEKAICDADILVSIGNAWSCAVPSKTIEYLSYGKPIIHFSLQKEDVCCEYLIRYPLALIIPADSTPKEAAERIQNFVKSNMKKTVPFEEIKKKFNENTPVYSAKQIDHILNLD